MNDEAIDLQTGPTAPRHRPRTSHSGPASSSPLQVRARNQSSSPSESHGTSPFVLPPLPTLRRERCPSESVTSPEYLRQRAGSGAYYAAAWGSPYATPSPRGSPHTAHSGGRFLGVDSGSPYASKQKLGRTRSTGHLDEYIAVEDENYTQRRKRLSTTRRLRNALSERQNWLSESEESGSNTSATTTPTREAYLDTWGLESVDRSSKKHRMTESLATITPDTFHDLGTSPLGSEHRRRPPSPSQETSMGEQERGSVEMEEKPAPAVAINVSAVEEGEKLSGSPAPAARPRPGSMQSYQRPKKKVVWRGKTCIIALPLTDRQSAGLPPLLTAQEIKDRIQGWIAAGYRVDGSDPDFPEGAPIESSGQSRAIYPDPTELQAERKSRQFQVHVPDQAEWESWVNHLKEEKLRALGVSPSNSEAPPPTRSPFSPALSQVSSTYPGLAHSPPIAPSSSGSNALKAGAHPFSPSLISSAGISPQPLHGYKQSIALPNVRGGIPSPFDPHLSQPGSLPPGIQPKIQPLSSRQNSFSPNHPLRLPNVGEVLSPVPQSGGLDMRGPGAKLGPEQGRPNYMVSQGHALPQGLNRHTPSPRLPPRVESLAHTKERNGDSRPPLEIAHPTPKSHRQNLSLALQREIDEAEAALYAKEAEREADSSGLTGHLDRIARNGSAMDESMNDEPPILRRPVTIPDEKSEIETNPSIAATPMLMDDKNPFANWQALSDAAKAEPRAGQDRPQTTRLNVEAKPFDPRAGFLSTNFSFGGDTYTPFGLPPPAPLPSIEKQAARSRVSMSHLNVEAPPFTPSSVSQKPVKETPFQFSSATFNVEAPEFNPTRPANVDLKRSVTDPTGAASNIPNSIFGNVVIDPTLKVSRRATKAVPIVPPKTRDYPRSGTDTDAEEDDGRPMPPTERQKRVRRSSDGDASPVFADSAPFNHSRILLDIVDHVEAKEPRSETPQEPVDGWSYIPAEEKPQSSEAETPVPQKEDGHVPAGESGFTFKDQRDAVKFDEARPLDIHRQATSQEDIETNNADEAGGLKQEVQKDFEVEKAKDGGEEPQAQAEVASSTAQGEKPKSSLSALAQPFEFKPSSSSPHGSSTFATPRKPQGLEASKYAVPTHSKQSSPEVTATVSSPPQAAYSYGEEEKSSESDVEEIVEVYEEVSGVEDNAGSDAEHESSSQSSGAENTGPQARGKNEYNGQSPRLRPQDETVPSFEEIDAVMKQFEVHPELGIERSETPLQSTPLVDMRLGRNFRSDAPSPSLSSKSISRKHQEAGTAEIDQSHNDASFGLGIGVHNLNSGRDDVSDWDDTLPATEDANLRLRSEFFDGHVRDLVGGLLEDRLGPLEKTLQVIQQSLASVVTSSRPKSSRRSMSTEPQDSDADDEDEDEEHYDAFEGFASYRAKSPAARRGGRRQDKIRAAVAEALAAYQPPVAPQPSIDMTEINQMVQEMRQITAQQAEKQNHTQLDFKAIVEDVISHHPRLRGSRVQQDQDDTKYKPQIDGLESMLKISKEHAAEEARLRRQAEEEVTQLKLRLRIAEEEAAQHRESSEEAQHSLQAFIEEKEAYKYLEGEVDALNLKNAALETTLEEYRVSSDQWREDVRFEREKNKELQETLRQLRQQLDDQADSRRNLRNKLERVQGHMIQVVHDLHAEQADWRDKEHRLHNRLATLENELELERKRRDKVEQDKAVLENELQSSLHLKPALGQSQLEVSRLNQLVASLQEENRALDTKVFNLDRELAHVINSKDAELATATAKLQAQLDGANARLHSIRTDSEAQISRLQSRLDHAELDIEDQKAKHDALMAETIEAHKEALREANEKRESALEDQHQAHEKKLNDLRDRHTRELHNSFDNRTRLEHHLNEKLNLSNDKVKHLESKVADLEERLAITKSAARAAAEAAAAKGVDTPTPAPSVVASPPQQATSASISLARGSDVPEKISPQALRESIMVLQDQLQNREQKIEKLEADLAAVDMEAPNKLKEREAEVAWLRELLNVRIDDLEDIINIVSSQPDFDRDSVKDAAIRLKTNLQMEQQIRERSTAATGSGAGLTTSFPSLSSALSTYAQSPKALPLAAAAAWGNWRRARETSIGGISDSASNVATAGSTSSSHTQTPSKSNVGSPASFLSGIMTPPSTNQRGGGGPSTSSWSLPAIVPPPSMRPVPSPAAASAIASPSPVQQQARKFSSEAAPRPLRAWSSQPRSLSSRQQEKKRESPGSQIQSPSQPQPQSQGLSQDGSQQNESTPSVARPATAASGLQSPRTPTPVQSLRTGPNMNLNLNLDSDLDLTEDIDDDASLLDNNSVAALPSTASQDNKNKHEPEPEHEHEHEHQDQSGEDSEA
ncbi:hypothetical protein HRR83_006594 [Exophiala dermatitidis]|uniref:FHA domain-containing protein n=1 Tax=Exophiala dermatitidis TaxID=5970 RepID=A0AAN6ESF7_EXODE|nr:hypothetical protein HRR74_005754 [Exophiala dermatitidis]KAJ4515421.1 hypothetical protein HRR73_005253 [Exophiala dermatitidis]KAJ4533745.1 hypothetical protein HRR77_008229 [Exophiala dermatitidis]KAJ4540948.1 hypothetical protein HRR76_004332 [Exophiala dermatitidis]KAJ4560580.1 hypothetical protein HRR79_007989 [Exophiala dermatitidis]